VACSHEVITGAGKFRADTPAKEAPKRAWQKLSAGSRANGHRFYDWTVVDLADQRPGSRQLLIRRHRSTGELAYYHCYSPTPVPLTTLMRVAGSRWRAEEFFPSGKGLAALDEHRVRHYASWSRWVTLGTLAHAFLAILPADEHARRPARDAHASNSSQELRRVTRGPQPIQHESDIRTGHPSRSQAGSPACNLLPRKLQSDHLAPQMAP
jgi:SRSO17 transposase